MDIDISIIILSYNTREMTKSCITSVQSSLKHASVSFEIIVIDNASQDGSSDMLTKLSAEDSHIRVRISPENTGFTKGNNIGLAMAKGKYILFLNSDTIIESVSFSKLIEYMDAHPHVGALTVAVLLPDGRLDPACHRGFPTPWRSFCYFIGLERTLGKIPQLRKIFGGYHLLDRDIGHLHMIDSPTGAFFLTRHALLLSLHGFDESYFMYGEDIDLAYRIHEKGYMIVFDPQFHITHYKSVSGLKHEHNAKERRTAKQYFYESMRIFYQKHFMKRYPWVINQCMLFGIAIKSNL